jgi:hypothetical protein
MKKKRKRKKKQGGKALKRSPPITTYRKNSHPLTIASSICIQLSKQQPQNKKIISPPAMHMSQSSLKGEMCKLQAIFAMTHHHFLRKIINKRGRLHSICCR